MNKQSEIFTALENLYGKNLSKPDTVAYITRHSNITSRFHYQYYEEDILVVYRLRNNIKVFHHEYILNPSQILEQISYILSLYE